MSRYTWAFILLFLNSMCCHAYIYRVMTFRSGSWVGVGPARIMLLFDYHESDSADTPQRELLLDYLLPKNNLHRALVIEDLHSKNSMGNQGFGQFELQQKTGGLMAGLAALVEAYGGLVCNVEYRYARVIGLAQPLAYPSINPNVFKSTRMISIDDIKNEVREAANIVFRVQSPSPYVRQLCQDMAVQGVRAFDICSSAFSGYPLAQFCRCFLPGVERANGIKQLLKADSRLLESLLLLALFSFGTTREVVVLAGGSHCAALASQLLRMGFKQELFMHDTRSMYNKKPPPISDGFLKSLL